mmetsp:Transcript_41876/g.100907  ORF Transcript_41876/g.100907 Transcript_41876/m.100907 type:complete len:223 (-) Transcript_41876:94-762(-)
MRHSNSENEALLLQAARDGKLSRVQELWVGGVDVNTKKDLFGHSPLYFACVNGQLEVVKFLLEKGADVRATDEDLDFKTPSDCIQSNDERGPQIRKLLLSRPLVPNSSEGTRSLMSDPIFPDALLSDKDEEKFPLHCAVKYGNLEIIKEALQETRNEADKNALDSNGRTAIDLAALTGQIKVLKLLAANGCKHKKPKPRMIAICKKRQGLSKKYLEQVEDSL